MSAQGSYGSCRGCGRELTVARTLYDGWHDACAHRSGLAQPLAAAGEVRGMLAIRAAPTGYADAASFGSGRAGRDRRRAVEVRKQACRACGQQLQVAPTRWVGYHDKCANRIDAQSRQAEPAPVRKLPRSEVGRPHLLVELGDQCYFCGDDLTAFTITREHLTPRSRGGANSGLNIVAACTRCNGMKGDLTEDEFVDWLRKVARNMRLEP